MTKTHYQFAKELSFFLFTAFVIAAFVIAGFNTPVSAFFAFVINLSARETARVIARRKLRKLARE